MQTVRFSLCNQLHHPPNHLLSHRVSLARLQPLSITRSVPVLRRHMSLSASRKTSVPHQMRTAAEPRQNRLYTVQLSHVDQINPKVRLVQLTIPPHVQSVEEEAQEDGESDQPQPFTFLPGQWLDVHIPSIADAGGFSITSTPADAQVLPSPGPPLESPADEETGLPPMDPRGRPPYVELAVQHAPFNPASAWFWRPKNQIIGQELNIRVGGSFVWPPSGVSLDDIKNVIFIVGGVGINPLISMLSHLNDNNDETALHNRPSTIHFLYSTKLPTEATPSLPEKTPEKTLEQILFLSRLRQIIRCQSQSHRLLITLELFLTNLHDTASPLLSEPREDLIIHPRRLTPDDLQKALKGKDGVIRPQETVCYVCGPPKMTDEVVSTLQKMLGDGKERLYFEKWW